MVQCLRCGEEFVPTTEADVIEGLCKRCLFDPDRIQIYVNETAATR